MTLWDKKAGTGRCVSHSDTALIEGLCFHKEIYMWRSHHVSTSRVAGTATNMA